jgi:hypothetical protein
MGARSPFLSTWEVFPNNKVQRVVQRWVTSDKMNGRPLFVFYDEEVLGELHFQILLLVQAYMEKFDVHIVLVD